MRQWSGLATGRLMVDLDREKINAALSVVLRAWLASKDGDLVDLVRRLGWAAAWARYGAPKEKSADCGDPKGHPAA